MSTSTCLSLTFLTVSDKICASRYPSLCILETRFNFASSYFSLLNLPGPQNLHHVRALIFFINLANFLSEKTSFPSKLISLTLTFLLRSTFTTRIWLLTSEQIGRAHV